MASTRTMAISFNRLYSSSRYRIYSSNYWVCQIYSLVASKDTLVCVFLFVFRFSFFDFRFSLLFFVVRFSIFEVWSTVSLCFPFSIFALFVFDIRGEIDHQVPNVNFIIFSFFLFLSFRAVFGYLGSECQNYISEYKQINFRMSNAILFFECQMLLCFPLFVFLFVFRFLFFVFQYLR